MLLPLEILGNMTGNTCNVLAPVPYLTGITTLLLQLPMVAMTNRANNTPIIVLFICFVVNDSVSDCGWALICNQPLQTLRWPMGLIKLLCNDSEKGSIHRRMVCNVCATIVYSLVHCTRMSSFECQSHEQIHVFHLVSRCDLLQNPPWRFWQFREHHHRLQLCQVLTNALDRDRMVCRRRLSQWISLSSGCLLVPSILDLSMSLES